MTTGTRNVLLRYAIMKLYFDLVDVRGRVADDVGEDFADLASARQEALASIRELIIDSLRMGRGLELDRSFEIRDSAGSIVAEVPFADALRPKLIPT